MSRIEDLAEAIVFAHEEGVSAVDAGERQAQELEQTAVFAAAALSPAAVPPSSLSSKLAADALKFCAEEQQLGPQERPGFTTPHPRSNGALLAFALGAAAACLVLWLARPGASAPSVAQLRAETTERAAARAEAEATAAYLAAVAEPLATRQAAWDEVAEAKEAQARHCKHQRTAAPEAPAPAEPAWRRRPYAAYSTVEYWRQYEGEIWNRRRVPLSPQRQTQAAGGAGVPGP